MIAENKTVKDVRRHSVNHVAELDSFSRAENALITITGS
jgi:hypothetical protein